MSAFDRFITSAFRRVGSLWEASIDSECTTFYGVFDAENRLESDATGMNVIIAGSVLHAPTSIAHKLTYGQTITDDKGKEWIVRDILRIDDGAVSRISLVEVEG